MIPNRAKRSESEMKSWKVSYKIAQDSLKNKTNHTKGALFFNTLNLGVRYKTKVQSVKIGNHVFY